MIVEDDEMTREVLGLLAEGEGFAVEAWGSGAAALEALAVGAQPQGVLVDMRMPGPSGETFARLARGACGEGTMLLAMSATALGAEEIRGYDGFLLKPFSMEEMCSALAGVRVREESGPADALKVATFEQLERAMGRERRRELYRVCLADAETRIAALRGAAAARDGEGWREAAHSLKGSCGMVGAGELAEMAAEMERGGLPGVDDEGPFAEMTAALARLRRILDAPLP